MSDCGTRPIRSPKTKRPILAEQALGELAAQEPRNAFASYRLAALLMAKTAYIEFHTVIMKALDDHSKRIDAEIQAGNITEQDIRERRRDNFPKFESESKESIAQRSWLMENWRKTSL